MKKIFSVLLLLLLLLLFNSIAFSQGSIVFKGSYYDALKKAENEDKLLLIKFYGNG